jgi:methylenetetrahydrofolate reductase (NADPH)
VEENCDHERKILLNVEQKRFTKLLNEYIMCYNVVMDKNRAYTLSFEMMPPRNYNAAPNFWECSQRLVGLRPDFISITYGAAGTDRKSSLEVIQKLVNDTPILPMAHLTCVATPRNQVEAVANDFLNAGVRMFLVLRGDDPKDAVFDYAGEQLRSSVEFTHLLRMLDKKQQRSSSVNKFAAIARPLVLCVATFPEGNQYLGTTPDQEIDRLLEKQDAGADFAITQLYYDPRVFDAFAVKARARGVTIPILAATLPTWDPNRLLRTEKNIHVPAPVALVRELEEATSEEEQREIGLEFWENIAREAINSGSPGVHMFTFNKANPPILLAERLGLAEVLAEV